MGVVDRCTEKGEYSIPVHSMIAVIANPWKNAARLLADSARPSDMRTFLEKYLPPPIIKDAHLVADR
jgi:hypothetical protein